MKDAFHCGWRWAERFPVTATAVGGGSSTRMTGCGQF